VVESNTPYNDTPAGDTADFSGRIYITTSVDTVWDGLINKEVTQKYWGRHNKSDWNKGPKWEPIGTDGSVIIDSPGEVLEATPLKALTVTWNAPDETENREAAPSVVSYGLVALGPDTRLTLMHRQLNQDSAMHKSVVQGWPAVMSNLKTVLERGKPLSNDQEGSPSAAV